MKTIKIIDLQKELPYKFKWKDNIYKLNGERYFRESDNWEPTFYLFQLDDEVEIVDEEDEFIDIEELKIDENGYIKFVDGIWKGRKMDVSLSNKINDLIKNQKKIIDKLKEEGK